jgi:hypothetical protein
MQSEVRARNRQTAIDHQPMKSAVAEGCAEWLDSRCPVMEHGMLSKVRCVKKVRELLSRGKRSVWCNEQTSCHRPIRAQSPCSTQGILGRWLFAEGHDN